MAFILVPDFGGELIEGFAWHISIGALDLIDPGDKLMPFLGRERQHAFFQLMYTHELILPQTETDFNLWFGI
ncbi:MAG: hypothetical protein DME26_15185 [Verrucomicrobia bacterium]|nr:MAG: hypothetical protein DME26_15185 [Verrucomicrobiota bacterium]